MASHRNESFFLKLWYSYFSSFPLISFLSHCFLLLFVSILLQAKNTFKFAKSLSIFHSSCRIKIIQLFNTILGLNTKTDCIIPKFFPSFPKKWTNLFSNEIYSEIKNSSSFLHNKFIFPKTWWFALLNSMKYGCTDCFLQLYKSKSLIFKIFQNLKAALWCIININYISSWRCQAKLRPWWKERAILRILNRLYKLYRQ